MSAIDDENSNTCDDNADIIAENCNANTVTILDDKQLTLDSNKNADIIGAKCTNKPQSVTNINLEDTNKESGDVSQDVLNENLIQSDKIELQLAKMTEESISDAPKCSGDFVSKISGESDGKSDAKINDVASKPTDINKKSAAICSLLDSNNDIVKTGDELEEVEDDDMKLTWDDDDTSDQVTAEGNGKSDTNQKDEILLEQQLLEEHNSNAEDSTEEINNTISEDNVLHETENHTKAENMKAVTDISMEKSIEEDKDDFLEDKLLDESEMDTDCTQISTKVNISKEKEVGSINESMLLEKSVISLTSAVVLEMDTTATKDNPLDHKLQQDTDINTDSSKIPSDKDMAIEKKANYDENKSKEEIILEKSEINAENVVIAVKDIEGNDDLMLEEQPLGEVETNVRSDKIPETNVSMTEDLDKIDDHLEDALLEETDVIPEADVSMAKLDESEEEVLINDESHDETAMDVDNTDQADDQATTKEKIFEQPMNDQNEIIENIVAEQAKIEPKNEAVSLDDPPKNPDTSVNDLAEKNLEDIDDLVKNPDTSINGQAEKILDQQIDEMAETGSANQKIGSTELITNSPLESQAITNVSNIDSEKEVTNSSNDKTEVEMKSELEKPAKITDTINEDINMNESNISSITPGDSPMPNKTHSLHKPDVMLEIPTQELIDIDTELSMNLDQSNEVDCPDADGNGCDDLVSENTGNEESELKGGKIQANISTYQSLNAKKAEDTDSERTIEENLEQMFAEDDATLKDALEPIATTSDKPKETDVQPSTSTFTMTPDNADEMPEVSDSLGLLAESSGRVMEDDDDPEDDDDGDDDDDFDQDESSNLVSAEQSEDSNPTPSETEPVRDQEEKDLETPESQDTQFGFTIDNAECSSREKAEKMEIEVEEYGTLQLQAESINDEETKSAVNALLKDAEAATTEKIEDPKKSTEQMEIETVKLSDTSDNEVEEPTPAQQAEQSGEDKEAKDKSSQSPAKQSPSKLSPSKQSPSKLQKLAIATMQASNVVNIVDLEESSSSEDDIQEVQKPPEEETQPEDKPASPDSESVTNVNIPTGIDVMCTSCGTTSDIVTKEGEVVISGVPKPPPQKPARLNTSEVSIKTASNAEPLVIPETKINEQTQAEAKPKPKLGLEIFSLDSDDEDGATKEKPATTSPHKMTALELEKARETSKCINYCCSSGKEVAYRVADAATVAYYDAGRKRRSMVCQPCAELVANRTKNLMQGIKDFTPLLELEMGKMSQDLVEISDSESEDEDMTPDEPKESIGEKGAKFLEENLAQILNETWRKYNMDCRLKETQIMLDDEIERLEQDSKEIDAMLNECQIATDKLRCELYATFEYRRHERPALILYDTPEYNFIGSEADSTAPAAETIETRQAKRRLSSSSETVAKRPAIPLGYAPLDADNSNSKDLKLTIPTPDTKLDDDKDISVVKLSAEAAPADLPPPGEISRPPLRVGMPVYAMKNAFGPWLKGRILEIQPKNSTSSHPFSLCRVKFDHKTKTNGKVLPARCIAYSEPADVRMTIGTRLIALFKDANKRESYYSGVVAEIPNPVNNYRYLVFFDDGYAQYVCHGGTRLVCESAALVWEEVHPFSREFVREYLLAYPERPMVRLHEGQHLKTEWNGKWWSSRVTKVDASLAQVTFVGDGRREWIYRGSTRLAPLYLELRAAERHRPRPMPRSKAQPRSNMPYVEYTRSDEPEPSKQTETQTQQQQQQNEEIRRQRAVAKKSTSVPQVTPPPQQQVNTNLDTVTSRVVYYTPKNAVKPYKMTPHKCGPKCKRSDVLSLKELRTYNPLAKPLLSGWERQIVRYKGHKEVMYRGPCGRRVRSMRELHQYLRATGSDLPVDLFDFHHATHCLAEFVLNKCLVGKKDLSHGKENVPVPCVNYYDESLPEFCSYNTERTPTAGVPLNLDPEFLCGCDCTDDCQDKSKCACWKMTLEGARTIGLDGPNVGYVYKRLPEPLPSGIYECNSRCKCKHTCLNRVAQHPLQLKLQVFKTPNRGWGIRALNDVPKGSFLCVYAGNLLTDATANLDGLNEGDEYLAELDYIEVVEQMKEGYEEDIPEADKKLDKKDKEDDNEDDDPSSSEDDDTASKTDKEDDDFRPGYIGLGVQEFSKRLRRREKSKKDKEAKEKEKDKDSKDSNAEEDCITISDDEEVREPSRFTVQAGMGAGEFISKYKSVRTLFGRDEACYIMDAKVQGNIGRYLNHSCCPNVFVQNVFVDTHDPRFPWVAFFALSHIKAGTELTWNYNYDVGSVPGKILYCYCGAYNCRGRLL